ncbi:MAG: hypothetical protein ACXAB2_05140 [Candidatus Hodarchaeales archaeon]
MIKNQMIRDNKNKFAGFFILSVIFIILTVLESILLIKGFNAFREQLRPAETFPPIVYVFFFLFLLILISLVMVLFTSIFFIKNLVNMREIID